jgi:hypothetical protein
MAQIDEAICFRMMEVRLAMRIASQAGKHGRIDTVSISTHTIGIQVLSGLAVTVFW